MLFLAVSQVVLHAGVLCGELPKKVVAWKRCLVNVLVIMAPLDQYYIYSRNW